MPWKILWTDQAARDLSKLDRSVARRVVAKLERAAEDPTRFFVRLAGGDDYKLRIGDWRLLAILDHESNAILVERVDHRPRIYRQRP
ncbi:MAG: type II toxin-antitoxin system RelE/ParE family toxin [Euryarchaeota archaeon]|nr:type II toxin-antitoxin system RelE/ParE family toxin [Euryarchaeota archaeon]